MIAVILTSARFDVKPEERDVCVAAIEAFVAAIEATQPGTTVYRSMNDVDDPNRFLHLFFFDSEEAEQIHRESDATKRFVDVLYPRCTKAPVFHRWTPVAMVDRT